MGRSRRRTARKDSRLPSASARSGGARRDDAGHGRLGDLLPHPANFDRPDYFLTGRQTTDDKVSGFKLGADDYLVKPFLPDELLARVESVLRRTYRARQPLSKLLRAGPDVIINPASHEVFVHGNLTPLQPAEYSLLILLAERPGEMVSINAIADALGISESQPRRDRVKWHVWKLRQAIERRSQASPIDPNRTGLRLSARKIRVTRRPRLERGFSLLLHPIFLIVSRRSPHTNHNSRLASSEVKP